MKTKNVFWALLLVAVGIFIIAASLGAFGSMNAWTVILTALLGVIILHSLVKLEFGGVFLPLAGLYLIYRGILALPSISPWLLFAAAILFSVAFEIIFSGARKHRKAAFVYTRSDTEGEAVEDSANTPVAQVSFGSSSLYLHAEALTRGSFSVSFGELTVYFDDAKLDPGGAQVNVQCSFGEMRLMIPRHWRVLDNISSALANVARNERYANPEEGAPTLRLTGSVSFGEIKIDYV